MQKSREAILGCFFVSSLNVLTIFLQYIRNKLELILKIYKENLSFLNHILISIINIKHQPTKPEKALKPKTLKTPKARNPHKALNARKHEPCLSHA
jgi:hypothetical protein